MKMQFEPGDIEEIARRVADRLKPLLVGVPGGEAEDEMLTVDEVAQFLKTSKAQIYQLVHNA